MATDIARLGIKVDSAGVVTAGTRLDRMTRSGQRAESTTQRMTRAFISLRGVLATLGLTFVVRGIIQLTDQFNLANSRIQLYTDSLKEAAGAQQALLDISNRTRSDMFATLDLFSRVSQARGELGRSAGELLKFVEQIQKLTIVSGATPQEAKNAIIQLSQGLSSGELRGEELRAVIEQLPAVARTIAESMGITVGKFRELAFEGKITAQTVVDGILSMAEQTDEKFSKVPVTVGQAWTVLKNNAVTAIAQVNNAIEGNQTLASGLMSAAGGVGAAIRDTYLFVAAGFDNVRTIFDEWIMLLEDTGVSWGGLKESASESLSFLGILLDHFTDKVVEGFRHIPINVKTVLEILLGMADRFRINAAAVIQTLALAVLDQWQAIQHTAEQMWLHVRRIFARGVDAVLNTVANMAERVGNAAFLLGLQGVEESMVSLAAAARNGADAEKGIAAAIAQSNAEREIEQALLIDQIALIENERRLKVAASEAATQAAMDERDAIIQRMEARIAERRALREAALGQGTAGIPLEGGGSGGKKDPIDAATEGTEDKLVELSQFAIQAARNIQSAFADFLFDPFEDGLKGMLRGFLDIIRRMIAEIAAAKVLQSLFGGFEGDGIFAAIGRVAGQSLAGSRAGGGPVQGGKTYQVAEFNRPEFFTAPRDGFITPASKAGGAVTIQMHNVFQAGFNPTDALPLLDQFEVRAKRMVEHRLQYGDFD